MTDFTLDLAAEIKTGTPDSDGWASFSGVASTSDADLADDVLEAGCFAPITAKHVALLLNHDPSQPLGKWKSFRQDGKRLIGEGAILLATEAAKTAYRQLKGGVLNALSVGFKIAKDGAVYGRDGGRRISRASLLEVSLVSVPANSHARILDVKSLQAAGTTALDRKIAALESSWADEDKARKAKLADLNVKIAELAQQAVAEGKIPDAQAVALLTELRDTQRALAG